MKPFTVLVGGDGAGKSTACARLRDEGRVQVLGLESLASSERYDFVGTAQHVLFGKVLSGTYGRELKLACLHVGVATLHDAITHARREHHVLVDGYYYKVLAKVACLGLDDPNLAAAWRALPKPVRVIHLRLDPERAFERIGDTRRLDPLEHGRERPSRASFVAFQRAMTARMMAEVEGLDVCEVDASLDPERVARAITEALPLAAASVPLTS